MEQNVWSLELIRAASLKMHCVRIYVDTILGEIPEDVSDEDYEQIETGYYDFMDYFAENLAPPTNARVPSWYIIKNGEIIAGEGYDSIPLFQGRGLEIANIITDAIK